MDTTNTTAAPAATQPERAAFEAWFGEHDTPEMAKRALARSSDGKYLLSVASQAWTVWQARAALAAPAAQEAEPLYWVRIGSDGAHYGPLPHAGMEDVRKRSGAWTPLYAHPPRPQADAGAVPEGWRLAAAPIAPDIAADIERSDWTAEEALRWYAAGKHYDTVPNGDGTSSARILDNGAIASNALKSLSRDYAEHKGDVALQEAAAPQAPAAATATVAEIDWDPLPEDEGERATFERQLCSLYRHDPRVAIATHLSIWAGTRGNGQFGQMCAIFANEVAKLQLAPQAPAAAVAPAAREMLEALQLVASKLESRPYGTGSYIPKPIREKVHAAIANYLQTAAAVAPTDSAADSIATAVCRQVAELPDRDSPEGWPEAMLVTGEELHMIVRAALGAAPTQEAAPLTQAARDVLAERRRQVEAEGWTPEHDDRYPPGTMARAAGCYATINTHPTPTMWPWASEWWKPRDDRSNYVRAAALLIAELESLDRAAARARQEGGGA